MKNENTKVTPQVQMMSDEELDMVNGGVATWVKNLVSEAPLIGPVVSDLMDDYDGTKKFSVKRAVADIFLGACDASVIGYPIRALGTGIHNLVKYCMGN